jgi:hypothetical protein
VGVLQPEMKLRLLNNKISAIARRLNNVEEVEAFALLFAILFAVFSMARLYFTKARELHSILDCYSICDALFVLCLCFCCTFLY